jgi:penicillin amidase
LLCYSQRPTGGIYANGAIFTDLFFKNLTYNILVDELGEDIVDAWVRLESIPVRVIKHLLADQPTSTLFDIKTTETVETRELIIILTMRQTVQQLTKKFGDETYEWRWEKLHTLTLEPPFFARAAKSPEAPGALKMIVKNILSSGPYAAPGHGMTINNAQYNWEKPFQAVLGPSIRRIIDLSDLRQVQTILPGGQSEHPTSDYYDNQVERWLRGEYRTLIQNRNEIDKNWPEMIFKSAKSN